MEGKLQPHSIENTSTITSFYLAKAFYKQRDFFDTIHHWHLNDALAKFTNDEGVILHPKADLFLPPSMMTNAHHHQRIKTYLSSHPAKKNRIINKKGETLEQQYARYHQFHHSKSVKSSIDIKRVKTLEKCISFLMPPESSLTDTKSTESIERPTPTFRSKL